MKYKLPIVFFLLFSVIACRKDFIVEDIDNKTLTINAPAADLQTDINTITFWWEPLDGAEEYNLQIVRPDFSKVTQLLLDTSITGTKFNFTFTPGTYQWRLKAANAGHSTAFQTFNIKIDTTSDLSQQVVNLLVPANGAVTGNTVVTFSWRELNAAKKYRFLLNEGTLKDTTLIGTSLTCTLQAAKNATTAFTWNVKAINDHTESQFNTSSYKFTVDLKGPGTPGLVSPVYDATVTIANDSLRWSRSGTDVAYDSLYIADDSTFTNYNQYKSDDAFMIANDLNLSPSTPGNYYFWKVRSFDLYGNGSSYSTKRRFKTK
ncbi:MAG: hypothetical protein JNL60_12820 [Bacteroidia bacterium]|nr:hypothetical protein [Bacteroidia bacterium]